MELMKTWVKWVKYQLIQLLILIQQQVKFPWIISKFYQLFQTVLTKLILQPHRYVGIDLKEQTNYVMMGI